eukprot:GHVP01053137.1.p1 GENE.GHVP01053137.1~~GHVP01053137.1.p1  ORF type:complete len:119 (-),score=20.18 GHVP01053137.1:102-458(-)
MENEFANITELFIQGANILKVDPTEFDVYGNANEDANTPTGNNGNWSIEVKLGPAAKRFPKFCKELQKDGTDSFSYSRLFKIQEFLRNREILQQGSEKINEISVEDDASRSENDDLEK